MAADGARRAGRRTGKKAAGPWASASSAGGPAGRKKLEVLRLRAAPHTPTPHFFSTSAAAARRSAQDDSFLEEHARLVLKVHDRLYKPAIGNP